MHKYLAQGRAALACFALAAALGCRAVCACAEAAPPSKASAASQAARQPQTFSTVARRLFGKTESWTLRYWRQKPPARRLLYFPAQPRLTEEDREAVGRMKAGEFRPAELFAWRPLGVPPPWDDNPLNNNSWDFYRHSLTWVAPLVKAWVCDGDEESFALLRTVVHDWRENNGERPGASRYAWYDHSLVYRLRVFCWLWELGRRQEVLDEDFAAELAELIHVHAELLAGGELYAPRSNHGVEQSSALVEAAILFPEFRDAERWAETARRRLATYVAENFSPEGFHLEQSPAYHWYVLSRLGKLAAYLRAVGQPPVAGLEETVRRAASVWPYLVRPDGRIANVGDTHDQQARDVRAYWRRWCPAASFEVAASTLPSPRRTPGEFLLSFEAGYAVFTAYSIDGAPPAADTYVLYKCNAFPYAHYHTDALSFIMYGLGRDWLVDPGAYAYEPEAPERKYVRSSRAHNVVLIDGQDFELGRVELVDFGRDAGGDYVCARHHLRQATHTRTLVFMSPHAVRIVDELVATDGKPHTYTQLFHLAPALRPVVESDRRARAGAADVASGCAPDAAVDWPPAAALVITQTGASGRWQVVCGQKEPHWQGWFSPGYLQIRPAPTLCYESAGQRKKCVFVTEIRLVPGDSAGAPGGSPARESED